MNDTSKKERQLILCFSTNSEIQMKIEELIHQWGYRMMVYKITDNKLSISNLPNKRQFAEPIDGDGGHIVEKITRLRPILLLFDIDSVGLPWERWGSMLSTVPATRRIPIVCIGKQTSVERLRTIGQVGAIDFIAVKDLEANLLGTITRYARLVDDSDYYVHCQQQLAQEAIFGLEAFNKRRYFESHEHLERAWMADDTNGKDLYRALLQVAVAYYQITRGNYRGAVKMFWRVRQWIGPLPEICRGVDIQNLRIDSSRVYDEIIRLGPQKIHEFNTEFLQSVKYEV